MTSQTSQRAPLERFLASRRTDQIKRYAGGRHVLDFGCGEFHWNLRSLVGHAASLAGFDLFFAGRPSFRVDGGITIYGALDEIKEPIDCIISLACFEHIEHDALPEVLKQLHRLSASNAFIVGTVPRPPAKPVLEFLSYKCRLIDKSQILDHKFYYDRTTLAANCRRGGWQLAEYRTFQLGMNSFFKLTKL